MWQRRETDHAQGTNVASLLVSHPVARHTLSGAPDDRSAMIRYAQRAPLHHSRPRPTTHQQTRTYTACLPAIACRDPAVAIPRKRYCRCWSSSIDELRELWCGVKLTLLGAA